VQRLAVRPPPAGRLKGGVNRRPYEVQWRAWRRPVPVRVNSVGDVGTVPGVALQWLVGRTGLTAMGRSLPLA
jgi:hypothetical protein